MKDNRISTAMIAIVAIIFFSLIWSSCGGPGDPVEGLRAANSKVPTFSIILNDMKEEGNFFKTYYHQYRLVTPEATKDTDFLEVPKELFEDRLPFLGMTLFSKIDGKETWLAGPPGYEYVGDERYGQWRQDESGQSFWVWYGKYALLSHLLGSRPIYRSHWDNYRTSVSQQRPYYGPNKGYGTNGSVTRAQKPDFFTRRQAADYSRKASFSNRVNQRIGRTKYSSRARSGGVGK